MMTGEVHIGRAEDGGATSKQLSLIHRRQQSKTSNKYLTELSSSKGPVEISPQRL